jgi:hypothetical protein
MDVGLLIVRLVFGHRSWPPMGHRNCLGGLAVWIDRHGRILRVFRISTGSPKSQRPQYWQVTGRNQTTVAWYLARGKASRSGPENAPLRHPVQLSVGRGAA